MDQKPGFSYNEVTENLVDVTQYISRAFRAKNRVSLAYPEGEKNTSKRICLYLVVLGLFLTACGTKTIEPQPTPLPTAVPPAENPGVGDWAMPFELEFSVGDWGPGVHRYQFFIHCPIVFPEDHNSEWIFFNVSDNAQLISSPVYLRLTGMSPAKLGPTGVQAIHPQQETVAVVTFLGVSENIAELAGDCDVLIRWDDKNPWILTPGEPFRP